MEHVVVECNELRDVLVDQRLNGKTDGTSIMLSAGRHTFTLGGVQNYSPASMEVRVSGTSIINPLILTFNVP